MTGRASRLITLFAVAAAAVVAGLSRISDLDFWWHLAAGRWIVQNRAVPRHDVFSYTAIGREWIDHEWLFQLAEFGVFSLFGVSGPTLLKCAIGALTCALTAWFLLERGVSARVTAGLVLLALAGGVTRYIDRPEMFSTLFAVCIYIALRQARDTGALRWLLVPPLISAIWANVHAAVIVGLVIQLIFVASSWLTGRRSMAFVGTLAASVAATGLNPFGYRILTVPFELTSIIDSGLLDNKEWRSPALLQVPFFFVALGLLVVVFATSWRRLDLFNVLLAAFLAFIALRYVRNVGLFCAFMPLLTGELLDAKRVRVAIGAVGLASFTFVMTFYYPFERGFGVASHFPQRLATFVESRALRGNMLNAYDFGGYLAWRLFPERPIFVDGRNEVFLPLLEKVAAARGDSRAWSALLREYAVEYAVVEYVPAIERVTVVGADGRATTSYAPVSVTRFPRSRWALVEFDDTGMVFVRRGGANAAFAGLEYTSLYPEGAGYQQHLIEKGAVRREIVIAEAERKLREDPGSSVGQRLLREAVQKR